MLLVDAQAVMGAVGKGRSSSNSLRREVMRIAALQLAGDLHLKLVYGPHRETLARGGANVPTKRGTGVAP